MITGREIGLLLQYIDSLEEASRQLEELYEDKNAEEVKKVKQFILDIKKKVDDILAV